MEPKKQQLRIDTRASYEEVIRTIERMRDRKDAPVDTQGAGCQSDATMPKEVQDFQTLTSLLLSVQTKDETTDLVMRRLVKEKFSLQTALDWSDEKLKTYIHEVNFNQKKVKYLKQCAQIIKTEHNGVVPNDYKAVLDLPGVGPKIANLFMQIAYNKLEGISVDTHVHRISNRLEWVSTKSPTRTKDELELLLDRRYWVDINPLLVGFGQQICKPVNPRCTDCLLQDQCPEGLRRKAGKPKI